MVLVNRTGGYRRWPTMQAFYDQRGGERSGESDFGVHNWANPLEYRATSNDRWRVSVVDDTRDVYAFKEPGEPAMLLGTILVTDADHECARRGHRISPHPLTARPTACLRAGPAAAVLDGLCIGSPSVWPVSRG